MRKKQKFVVLNTTEEKYIVDSMASCEAVWSRNLFGELFEKVLDTIVIYCENKSKM